MKKLIILALILLASCDGGPRRTGGHTIRVRVTHLDPPKHVYVDLENVDTGEKWTHVFVNKHCNSWKTVNTSEIFLVNEYSYEVGSRKYRELDVSMLYNQMCQR